MKKNCKREPRKVICSNDLVQSIKEHNLVEHRLFYDLYRHRVIQEMINHEEYDSLNGVAYISFDKIKDILGKRYSRNELLELINNSPKEVRIKGNVDGFISIYEFMIIDEFGDIEYKYTDKFEEFASYTFPKKKPHTTLMLNELEQLNKTYSQRLYEVYKQYSGNLGQKGQNNYLMPIKYLYEFFGITDEFGQPRNIRISEVLRVGIDPAIKEIHDKLQIPITYKKIKKGNKITHIHFYFA